MQYPFFVLSAIIKKGLYADAVIRNNTIYEEITYALTETEAGRTA